MLKKPLTATRNKNSPPTTLRRHKGYVRQLKTAARLAPPVPILIAHVTVLMREPLHHPVPWAEIPADPNLPGTFSRASASSAEEYHRARTPTPTVSQNPGRRSDHPQRPLPRA